MPRSVETYWNISEGDGRLDQLDAGGLVDELGDEAPAGVDVADDVAHVVLGRRNLDLHDGLEQARAALAHALAERLAGRDLEGEHRGVDVVVGAVVEGGGDVDDGEAGEDAGGLELSVVEELGGGEGESEFFCFKNEKNPNVFPPFFLFLSFTFLSPVDSLSLPFTLSLSPVLSLSLSPKPCKLRKHQAHHHLLEPFRHAGDVLLGDHASLDVGLEDEAGAGLPGLEPDGDVGELARAAGLLLVDVADVGELGDGLAVVDLVFFGRVEEERGREKVSEFFCSSVLFAGKENSLIIISLSLSLSPEEPRRRTPP